LDNVAYSYFRKGHAVAFVFDVTDPKCFERARQDFSEFRRREAEFGPRPPLALIANKMDLGDPAGLLSQGREFAERNGMLFFQVSAATGENVRETFEAIAEMAVRFYSEGSGILLDYLVVGDRGVGKTSLVAGWFGEDFRSEYEPTDLVACRWKGVSIDGEPAKLQVRDFSGSEGVQSLRGQPYRPDAVILVYDAATPQTYQQIPRWLRAVSDLPGMKDRKVPMFIVGNKTDLVSEQRGIPVSRKKAGKSQVFFYDVSVKLGTEMATFRATVLRTMRAAKAPTDKPKTK
jgi:small GTP-binding protein